jgi:hypothetical protein
MQRAAHRFRYVPATAALLAFAAWQPDSSGQTFISAMAGYIHHVEGQVFLSDKPVQPKPTDFLHVLDGQRLRTAEGRAEIMLTPGSFLRLGAHSEVKMISAGLASARFEVTEGSAVVDLLSIFEKDAITVVAEDSEVRFPKPGRYRLNAGDPPALLVFRGKAVVVTGGGERGLKGKQTVALSGTGVTEVEKFDPQEKDPLDEWNQVRAKTLEQIARQPREGQGGMDPGERELIELIMRRPREGPTFRGPGGGGGRSGGGGGGGQSQRSGGGARPGRAR